MSLVLTLLALVLAAFGALRLYALLALLERQVIACWERLDTLLAQRNGYLQTLLAEQPASPAPPATGALGPLLERQERARIGASMPELVATERDLRHVLDRIPRTGGAAATAVRHAVVLQRALDDVAARYDDAVDRYDRARGRLAARILAPMFRFPVYSPLVPRRESAPPQ